MRDEKGKAKSEISTQEPGDRELVRFMGIEGISSSDCIKLLPNASSVIFSIIEETREIQKSVT